MLHALIPFILFVVILAIVCWVIIMAIDWVPAIPSQIKMLVKVVVGIIAFIMVLDRALPLLGYSGAF